MSKDSASCRRDLNALLLALLGCVAATFFHHAHNAELLGEYPNMPASLTRVSVYAVWLGATVAGITGYVLVRQGWRRSGLALLVLYGAYGLDGFAHYALAPMSAHTAAMNLSILLEAFAGVALLVAIAREMRKMKHGGARFLV